MLEDIQMYTFEDIQNTESENDVDSIIPLDISDDADKKLLEDTEVGKTVDSEMLSFDDIEESEDLMPVDGLVISFEDDTLADVNVNLCKESSIENTEVACTEETELFIEEDTAEDTEEGIEEDTEEGIVEDTEEGIEEDTEEDIEETTVSSTTEGVIYEKGMSLIEFLRQNPNIRDRTQIEEYFTKDIIYKAIRTGIIVCMRNRIVL